VVRELCVVRSSAGYKYQPCSWVRKEGIEEEKEREIYKLRVQIELYVFIYYIIKNIYVDVSIGIG
jgi:hypothetical protein